jgi:uncharacterized membrane protein
VSESTRGVCVSTTNDAHTGLWSLVLLMLVLVLVLVLVEVVFMLYNEQGAMNTNNSSMNNKYKETTTR